MDATGLEGKWDFTLQWTRRSQLLPEGAKRTTIADATERDLGLSLTLQQAPAPVLVIERADRPTPNAPGVEQQLPPRNLSFEVATVKLDQNPQHQPFRPTRAGLQVPSALLLTALAYAWDFNTAHARSHFAGLPKGIDSVSISIEARTSKNPDPTVVEAASDDDLRVMTRNLLQERFQMKWHYVNRNLEGYSLLVDKSKLKRADPTRRASCAEARTMANDPRDANPLLTTVLSCRNVTMAQFASVLHPLDDHLFVYPVEDATGMEGTYDFDLSFTGARLLELPETQLNGGIPLAEAISKQLGLKLVKRRRQLPVVVIDQMALTPTAN